jgi:hypothetical protein
MRLARPAAVLALSLLLTSGAGAATRGTSTSSGLAAPQQLHGFLLRANEPAADTFTRTPSFAWRPVAGSKRYEFQLATSRTFSSGALLTRRTTRVPAVSVAVALPWMTGTPYSLYARVRGLEPNGAPGPWGTPVGFNMRWTTLPEQLAAPPGLVHWSPVDGATSYEVWYLDANKIFRTQTTVADEREYYTFHQNPAWTQTVHWRVRAVRDLYGAVLNKLPAVSYGPWSPTFTSTNPPLATGNLTTDESISDVASTATDPAAHHVMPGFAFSGDTGLSGHSTELYRVYVATDRDCVNVVFRSAIVGSPAYAPRWNGTLLLPTKQGDLELARTKFLPTGPEGKTWTADAAPVTANEALPPDVTTISSGEDDSPPGGGGSHASKVRRATLAVAAGSVGPPVDLWDTDWPTGRYYWTVVPVVALMKTDDAGGDPHIEYDDLEVPQDACAAGRVLAFGKTSRPAVASSGYAPFASGLSPTGSLVSPAQAKPSFYGSPLVSWQPALGASAYEIQWSKTRYPFVTAGTPILTYGTSTSLPLKPGTWWYRVRGLNLALPAGARAMAWSPSMQLVVAKPTFKIVAG